MRDYVADLRNAHAVAQELAADGCEIIGIDFLPDGPTIHLNDLTVPASVRKRGKRQRYVNPYEKVTFEDRGTKVFWLVYQGAGAHA